MSFTVNYSEMRPIAERFRDIHFNYDLPDHVVRAYTAGLRAYADELDALVDRLERENGGGR